MTTNDTAAQTPAARTGASPAVRSRLRIAVAVVSVAVAADLGYQMSQHHTPTALISTMVFSVLGNGIWMGNRLAAGPAPQPGTFTCAATGCPVTVTNPLPLPEVLVDTAGAAIPDEAFMPVVPEMDDDTLFIGHITAGEANRRLRARGVEYPHAGVPVVQGDVLHAWVLFEQHQGHCAQHPDTSHDHNPWHIIHVTAGTRGAIPVTLAFADEEW